MPDRTIRNKIALAVDNITKLSEIEALILATVQWIGVYKIGLEQFIRFGSPILDTIRKMDRKIFLDLKLHDIPNTVAKAVLSACELGVDYLTVHIMGGSAMINAAMEAKNSYPGKIKPAIIGVTVLTSIDTAILNLELKIGNDVKDYVTHLVRLAVASGIDGIVCSAADLPVITPVIPKNYIVITPGIRPAGSVSNDQKRIATPLEAINSGASLLVLGRAVTAAANPGRAAEYIYKEIATVFDK